jgi:hypothetical protein
MGWELFAITTAIFEVSAVCMRCNVIVNDSLIIMRVVWGNIRNPVSMPMDIDLENVAYRRTQRFMCMPVNAAGTRRVIVYNGMCMGSNLYNRTIFVGIVSVHMERGLALIATSTGEFFIIRGVIDVVVWALIWPKRRSGKTLVVHMAFPKANATCGSRCRFMIVLTWRTELVGFAALAKLMFVPRVRLCSVSHMVVVGVKDMSYFRCAVVMDVKILC